MTRTKIDSVYWYKVGKIKKFAYRYKYYDNLGKRREKAKQGFDTIEQAERALIDVKAAILDGNSEAVSNENLKLAQWLDKWYELKKRRWEPTTKALYTGLIKNQLKPRLGNTPLHKLTRLYVQSKLIDAMVDEKYAGNTIKRAAAVLTTSLNDALDEGVIRNKPYEKLDFSKVDPPKKRTTLQLDELKYLIECVEKENITRRTVLYLLMFLGMRGGEVMALRYEDVDLQNRTIKIKETRSYYKKDSGRPKSKNSYRTLKIPQNLYDKLLEYDQWYNKKIKETGQIIHSKSYYIISDSGIRVNAGYINKIFTYLREKYDLEGVTGHVLRHTYASILISQNIPLSTVAKLLGDTVDTVVKVYVHSLDEQEKDVLNIMENLSKLEK